MRGNWDWTRSTSRTASLSVPRHLAGEVAKEWQEVEENDKTQQEMLLKLVKEIVPYNMAHNAEHEACDLLMEIERLDMLEDYIDENAYGKVCLYLTRYVPLRKKKNEPPYVARGIRLAHASTRLSSDRDVPRPSASLHQLRELCSGARKLGAAEVRPKHLPKVQPLSRGPALGPDAQRCGAGGKHLHVLQRHVRIRTN